MERTRRSFIRATAVVGGIAGISGTALAGDKCKKDDDGDGDDGCPSDLPGKEIGQARGHKGDKGNPGDEAHDSDDDGVKPGRRIGHCKYDE